jgi:RNA polymerase sigma factor (sigma-70 family)
VSEYKAPPTAARPDSLDPFDREWSKVEAAIVRYLRVRLKSTADALRVSDAVYWKVRNCSKTATILDLESYAITAAKRLEAGWRRKNARQLRLNLRFLEQQSASRGDADELTPERICAGQQEFARTAEVFKQLPVESQLICEASAKGEEIKSIAARLGLQQHTVYRRLRSARQWLRETLGLAGDRKP